MKKLSVSTLIALATVAATSVAQKPELHFAIISDVHVMAPEILVEPGKAFDQYMSYDRKMLCESTALLHEATDQLLHEHPQFVLLTGDLTKDGEEISHRYLVKNCLERLRNAGIPVYVIPGNHDINNPHAVEFLGDTTRRIKTISSEEFAHIYADYGYGSAIARDTCSLTYVAQITPDTRLLGIDACRYDDNDFDTDKCYHEGRLKDATQTFIKEQLTAADNAGMRIIVMMHHGLMEHWEHQNEALPGYVVDDYKKIRKMLKKQGVEFVFTGHSHSQDIVKGKGVYDIETGSLVSYPSPYRVCRLSDTQLKISSRHIDHIKFDTEGLDFQKYARNIAVQGFKNVAAAMFSSVEVDANVKENALQMVADAMADNYLGDEKLTDNLKDSIKTTRKALKKYTFKWSLIFKAVTTSLWSDIEPADNELTITLNSK